MLASLFKSSTVYSYINSKGYYIDYENVIFEEIDDVSGFMTTGLSGVNAETGNNVIVGVLQRNNFPTADPDISEFIHPEDVFILTETRNVTPKNGRSTTLVKILLIIMLNRLKALG